MKHKDFAADYPGSLQAISDDVLAFVPDSLPPPLTISEEVLRLSERCLLSLGKLEASISNLPNPELITSPFLRREAVLSSKIEGTHTELEQLYMFEAESNEDDAQVDDAPEIQDAREVHNYVRALEFGLLRIELLPICNRLLKEMHDILLTGIPEGRSKDPGQFRTRQAFIGGADIKSARFVAAPVPEIESLMHRLEKYIHEAGDTFPLLARVAAIHYQFEAIHPFSDGNGRLGRLLISLLLCEFGLLGKPLLYLSAYFERNREEYNQHLWQISRCGAWNEWFLFFLEGVHSQSQDAIERASKLMAMREEYRNRFQQSRGSATVIALVDSLFRHPVLNTNRAMSIMGVTWPAANQTVQKLLDEKILVPLGDRKRNKLYYAKQILEALH